MCGCSWLLSLLRFGATQVFCGVLARVSQFSDILLDVKQHQLRCQQHQHQDQQQPQSLEEQQSTSIEQRQLQQPQPPSYQQQQPSPDVQQQSGRWAYAILGDLNTMAHGIARLSPNYCRDAMRWLSLGCSEAAWWQRNVLSVTGRWMCLCKAGPGVVAVVCQSSVNHLSVICHRASCCREAWSLTRVLEHLPRVRIACHCPRFQHSKCVDKRCGWRPHQLLS